MPSAGAGRVVLRTVTQRTVEMWELSSSYCFDPAEDDPTSSPTSNPTGATERPLMGRNLAPVPTACRWPMLPSADLASE
ncbi:hypothetical protein ACIBCT_37525 [Streptosporangium sp. NPDC050855]|uniref:hypothetical protein n=1 Tax=Streptosporangium sp. NPDC050855 TaxID=3366194 RepID=UPI003791226A